MSKVFELRELRKEYGGILALDLPKLDIMQGDLVSLVGRNGSGKSAACFRFGFIFFLATRKKSQDNAR